MQPALASSDALLFCEIGIAGVLMLIIVGWAGPRISEWRSYRAKEEYVEELRRK
ncbi:MAG: hypothetical protein WA137_06300 [Methanothrix sp.]